MTVNYRNRPKVKSTDSLLMAFEYDICLECQISDVTLSAGKVP